MSNKTNNHVIEANKYLRSLAGVLGVFFINLPSALAIPTKRISAANPCPGIYYEEPYNSRLIVPRKCAPNAATLRWLKGKPAPKQPFLQLSEDIPSAGNEVKPVDELPLPESSNQAIAVINLNEGKVNVKLKNDTNTPIVYQVIEHTKKRYIRGKQEITLQDLPTPVTITMRRNDGGFIKVNPKSRNSEKATLNISLDESEKLDDARGVLRIKKDGQVLLN
ncbi:hypothetical protein [Mastigocoleus testarum]|uniref:Uncharacterized protein n=1 Tax=Mastigocoleus testarum BC008 TaxID=371196 RepID=A0A0V7ZYD3_9CYAN|nr:hypothetical protein [Mastigocoleus testarum]KST69561.1 hypothetical protein BC008_04480 [Mastigocoleus testarum BC008]